MSAAELNLRRVAERFGRLDFDGFLAETTAAQLNGWAAYEEQAQTSWRPDWWPFADLMAWMRAMHPNDPKAMSPAAFMPGAAGPAKAETSGEKAERVKAAGGRVFEPPPLITYTPKPGG